MILEKVAKDQMDPSGQSQKPRQVVNIVGDKLEKEEQSGTDATKESPGSDIHIHNLRQNVTIVDAQIPAEIEVVVHSVFLGMVWILSTSFQYKFTPNSRIQQQVLDESFCMICFATEWKEPRTTESKPCRGAKGFVVAIYFVQQSKRP